MDELTETDIARLTSGPSSCTSSWIPLPKSCCFKSSALYVKIYHSLESSRLILLLTDLRSSIWFETLESLRSIHVRLRLSARESAESQDSQSQSGISEFGQEKAVEVLFGEIRHWYTYAGQNAHLDVRSDDELELVLQLQTTSFRFRLDKMMSGQLQSQLIYDTFIQPTMGVLYTMRESQKSRLEDIEQDIDSSAAGQVEAPALLLSALQRYSQAAAGTSLSERARIAKLPEAVQKSPEPAVQNKHLKKVAVAEEQDPDATLESPPGSPQRRNVYPRKSDTSDRKGKGREKPNEGVAADEGDSDVTVDSEDEGKAAGVSSSKVRRDKDAGSDEDQVHLPHTTSPARHKRRVADSPSPPANDPAPPASKAAKRKASHSTSPAPETKPSSKKQKESAAAPASTPAVPVLRRPVATRGGLAGRGKKGMQWSHFG